MSFGRPAFRFKLETIPRIQVFEHPQQTLDVVRRPLVDDVEVDGRQGRSAHHRRHTSDDDEPHLGGAQASKDVKQIACLH